MKALDNRFYVKFMQLEICLLSIICRTNEKKSYSNVEVF